MAVENWKTRLIWSKLQSKSKALPCLPQAQWFSNWNEHKNHPESLLKKKKKQHILGLYSKRFGAFFHRHLSWLWCRSAHLENPCIKKTKWEGHAIGCRRGGTGVRCQGSSESEDERCTISVCLHNGLVAGFFVPRLAFWVIMTRENAKELDSRNARIPEDIRLELFTGWGKTIVNGTPGIVITPTFSSTASSQIPVRR